MNDTVAKKGQGNPDLDFLRKDTKNETEKTHLNSSMTRTFKYRQYIYYLIDLKFIYLVKQHLFSVNNIVIEKQKMQ